MNLSRDVFERRTSTGSGLFSFLDSGFAHLLGQLVSIIVKTLRNTNLGASRCFKMKKTSLPVDVRRSKTPLLKLPNDPPSGVLLEHLAGNMQHALSISLTHQVKRLINIKVIIEMITKGKVSFF